jgi:hypothetical protein
MRKMSVITVIMVFLMMSSLSAAGVNKIVAARSTVEADRVIVPIELNNIQEMSALDLPLEFSEGVTLEEVSFAGTRSENFDFTAAKIDNEENMVILGLIPMVYGENADLAPGAGEVARLIFRIDDPSLAELNISPVSLENHYPMFVYTESVDGAAHTRVLEPEFSEITIALAQNPGEVEDVLPTEFALKQNYPNPFNPSTNLMFDLPAAAHVNLEILNVLGQKVRTLVDEFREAGSYTVTWDGANDYGRTVASGVYFYRISAGENQAVKKMMMLK